MMYIGGRGIRAAQFDWNIFLSDSTTIHAPGPVKLQTVILIDTSYCQQELYGVTVTGRNKLER